MQRKNISSFLISLKNNLFNILPNNKYLNQAEYGSFSIKQKKFFWAQNPLVGDIEINISQLSPFKSIKMHCENDDTVVKELYWSGFSGWEPASLHIWCELLKRIEGGLVLDVGSYSGIYTLIAARIREDCDIIALDIQSRCLDRVSENSFINNLRNIECKLAACSDFDGQADFYFYDESGIMSSIASLVPKKINNKSAKIDVIKLDTYVEVEKNGRLVSLVKIDVEDAEAATLRGMQKLLKVSNPDILIEINDINNIEIVRSLIPDSYNIVGINESAFDVFDAMNRHIEGSGSRNYLLTNRPISEIHELMAS